MSDAIVAHGLSKRYGQRMAVDNLTFSVETGSIFGFLGPNGSGKSTTIKMLCALVEPSSGSGSVNGHDIAREGDAVRRSIGYMSQSFALYSDMSVHENLEFYGRAYGLDAAKRQARRRAVIELTGLGPYEEQSAGTLSGGWQQRLALATALIHEPPVIFLDEPTAGIDPVARRQLWDLLFQLAGSGVTLFVTTHYMDEAERCARVGYIYEGHLLAVGTREELQRLRGVQPPGTVRYRVGTERIMAAFSAARRLEYIRDVTIFGRDLHLLVDTSVAPERIKADLGSAGGVTEVERIEPSLEDVFVALTRSQTSEKTVA